ncbi:putative ribosomal N-acetyltransferase YdaF [compost metagenome]
MIAGHHIRLRALERDDLDSLFNWWNDPALWTLIGSRARISGSEELEQWFEGELDKGSPQEGRTFAIDDQKGNLVGTVWYGTYEAGDRQATVGLYLGDAEHRGQGHGTDALGTLCRYLFDELGLHKARLYVACDNDPAIAVYRKLGFVEEGRLREHRFYGGTFHDFLVMGLLSREFSRS